MTAQEIQDSVSRYEGNMFLGSRLAVPFSLNPKYDPLSVNNTVNITAQVPYQPRFHPRDRPETQQLDVTWWDKADNRGPNGAGLQIMALPYLPFFSNCRGYDSHVMIAKLLEDHPNCSRVAMQETEFVAQLWWQGPTGVAQRPTSDECTLSYQESENYNTLWRMSPPDGFPDEESIDYRRESSEALGHYYLTPVMPAGGNIPNPEQKQSGRKGVKLSCQYEEPIYSPAATPRWYQQPTAKPIFWLSKWPQPVQDFAAIPGDPEEPDDPGFGWGRTPRVLDMYEISNREKLVPVQVGGSSGPGPGQALMVPRTVVIDISFFQRSKGTQIVDGLDYRLSREDPNANETEIAANKEKEGSRRMRQLLQAGLAGLAPSPSNLGGDATGTGPASAPVIAKSQTLYQDEPPTVLAESSKTLVKASIDFYDKCAITDVPKLLTQFAKLEPPVFICDAVQLSYCNMDTKMCESPVNSTWYVKNSKS